VQRVVVDSQEAVARVNSFLGPDQANLQVEYHDDASEILEHYKVHAAIRDALKPRVDLPSGGYVIIEPTEALTVVDVNSGSFTRSANARETVLWTNCEAATEIARQLKLRNIGGVVIIDFIDMESRRDQLMLLEHFTQAMRDDQARPQIAQITELGLVELTRKRQGQNIYELFGRACPSCGGLGHVVTLPGKDTLQPLAALPGLVRSVASARAEVSSPSAGDAGGRRRRRGGRGNGDGSEGYGSDLEALPLSNGTPTVNASPTAMATAPAESRRNDPELLAVAMDDSQELVYGWLGLNPALLADPAPSDLDNVIVRVVRPGEDAEQLLEAARQELAAHGPRRRRRQRGSGDSRGESGPDEGSPLDGGSDGGYAPTAMVEITPLEISPFDTELVPIETLLTPEPTSTPVPAPRRSGTAKAKSAAAEAPTATAAATAPVPEPEPEAVVDADADAAGEGRRRRRRSSAS
jgi:ribonuclease E